MQTKDIETLPILQFLAKQVKPATWLSPSGLLPDVATVMPSDTPRKVILAKMRSLIKKKLVNGCDCGCRGDFEISDKGKIFLRNNS